MLETKRYADKLLKGEQLTKEEVIDLLHTCNTALNNVQNLRLMLTFSEQEKDNLAKAVYEASQLIQKERNATSLWESQYRALYAEHQALASKLQHEELARAYEEDAPEPHHIDVGDIVEIDGWRGRVVERPYPASVVVKRPSGAKVNHRIDMLSLTFPASHPVALSLASRKEGEYRTGDVVRAVSIDDNVIVGELCGSGGFYDSDGDFWSGNQRTELITPRELRTDIGEASGGEWEKWFTTDGWVSDEAREVNPDWAMQIKRQQVWLPRKGDWVRVKSTGQVLRADADYTPDRDVSNLEPWTPQVGDEVRVLVGRSMSDNHIDTDVKHIINTVWPAGVRIEPSNDANKYLRVTTCQLEPWTERKDCSTCKYDGNGIVGRPCGRCMTDVEGKTTPSQWQPKE